MDIGKFLNDEYRCEVHKTPMGGFRVDFISEIEYSNSTVWFERAKRGWVKKPITTTNYLIVDADTSGLFKFLKQFHNVKEEELPIIRENLVRKSLNILNEFIEKGNQE
jgi:hypothetical protein